MSIARTSQKAKKFNGIDMEEAVRDLLKLHIPQLEGEESLFDAYDDNGRSYEIKSCSLFVRGAKGKGVRLGRFVPRNGYMSPPDFYIFVFHYGRRLIFVKLVKFKNAEYMKDKARASVFEVNELDGEEVDLDAQ